MKESNQSEKTSNLRWVVKIILPTLLGLICLYYILFNFEWAKIGQILQSADILKFLISSIIATIAFWLLRTWRWAFLLRSENLDISFIKLYLYTAVTVGFANFTPFQSGEALKVELLRKYGGQRLSGYTFFIVEKLLDLLVISALSLFGILFVLNFEIAQYLQFILIGLVIILLVAIASIFFVVRTRKLTLQIFKQGTFPTYLTLIITVCLTLASWVVMITGWKFMLQSIAIDLTFLQTSAIISLTTIIGILSLVPGAIGVTELSIAALLSQISVPNTNAQAGAIIMAIYSLVILLMATIHLIILKTIKFKK